MGPVKADQSAEMAVLGSVAMLGEKCLPLLHQQGLRSEHFYFYQPIWEKVLAAAAVGPVDHVIVPELEIHAGMVPTLTNLDGYARQVINKARWRQVEHASYILKEASEDEDETALAEAERMLTRPADSNRVYTRSRLQDVMRDRLKAKKVAGWKLPLLNARVRPGTVWLWGGHTSHGKSVWLDQCAREFHEQGARIWTWLNEMTAEERVCRHVAADTGIALERIEENDLTPDEQEDVIAAMARMPFEIVECPGWSVEEIARDIRMRKLDVAMIDIIHKIPYETERDLGRISRALGDAAKLAGCVIMATVHLNRGRIQEAVRPVPTLSDIKGASSFEQDADVIGFVWREDDSTTGRPGENGLITISKFRQGKPGGREVWLQGNVATFHGRL